jgi:predicted nucleic acid-binding Zn ribbon protein
MKCPHCGAEIPEGSAFCGECGAKLETKKSPILWISIAAVVVLVAVVVPLVVVHSNNQKAAEKAALVEKARQDSIAAANLAAEQARIANEQRALQEERERLEESKKSQSTQSSTGKATTHSLSYGSWTGSWKNGQPNGTGTLRYSQQHLIDKRDRKKRMAEPGDYIIGEFVEGKLVQGTLYDSNNNVKASIVIGL